MYIGHMSKSTTTPTTDELILELGNRRFSARVGRRNSINNGRITWIEQTLKARGLPEHAINRIR